jgi:hypothetical protein
VVESAKRPFWLHQFAEYVIGAALVGSGLQSPSPTIPAVLGGLVILNAAIVDALLGAFRIVGRRVHRILDILLLGLGVLATALPGLDLGTRIVQLCCLIVFATVVMNTNYSPNKANRSDVQTRESVSDSRDRPEDIGRRAGRIAGTLASRARDKWRA